MADRRVTRTRKDKDGDITAICNANATWSPRSKADAISDIKSPSGHTYYVENGAGRSDIQVINDSSVSGGRYLRTDPNGSCTDNLDTLPDC